MLDKDEFFGKNLDPKEAKVNKSELDEGVSCGANLGDKKVLGDLTVNDVVEAQVRSRKNIDPNKDCHTCRHKEKGEEAEPCKDCINSFLGIMFDPSNWESN